MLKVTGNGTPEFYCYIHVKTFTDGGECFADDFSRVIMSMKIDDHLIKKAEPALKQIPLSDSRGFYRRGWRSIGAFASVWSHSTFGK